MTAAQLSARPAPPGRFIVRRGGSRSRQLSRLDLPGCLCYICTKGEAPGRRGVLDAVHLVAVLGVSGFDLLPALGACTAGGFYSLGLDSLLLLGVV